MNLALVIIDWCQSVSQVDENSFVKCLRADGFDNAQILKILDNLANHCYFCFNGPASCSCMKDD